MEITTVPDGSQFQCIKITDSIGVQWLANAETLTKSKRPEDAQVFSPEDALKTYWRLVKIGYEGLSITNALPLPANACQLPAIGETVKVNSGGSIFAGVVTGHDAKDGKPHFFYECDFPGATGEVVKSEKWAWPEQIYSPELEYLIGALTQKEAQSLMDLLPGDPSGFPGGELSLGAMRVKIRQAYFRGDVSEAHIKQNSSSVSKSPILGVLTKQDSESIKEFKQRCADYMSSCDPKGYQFIARCAIYDGNWLSSSTRWGSFFGDDLPSETCVLVGYNGPGRSKYAYEQAWIDAAERNSDLAQRDLVQGESESIACRPTGG